MERIHYAGGTVVTGTEISRALLQYAAALAKNDSSDMVGVPIRDESGGLTHANLLIGPASQLISFPEEGSSEELVDDDLVTELHAKTERLGPRRAIADGEAFVEGDLDEFGSSLFDDET